MYVLVIAQNRRTNKFQFVPTIVANLGFISLCHRSANNCSDTATATASAPSTAAAMPHLPVEKLLTGWMPLAPGWLAELMTLFQYFSSPRVCHFSFEISSSSTTSTCC